jgi:hypothetical protein
MSEHVRMWPDDPHARVLGEVAQAADGRVPVHPGAAAVEQDRAAGPVRGGTVDGPADRGGQRDQARLAFFAIAHRNERTNCPWLGPFQIPAEHLLVPRRVHARVLTPRTASYGYDVARRLQENVTSPECGSPPGIVTT